MRERSRLRRYIRRRVRDSEEVEDVLQDVFAELVRANRLLMPIEHVTAWLFRVARNRITDLFRKQRPLRLSDMGRGSVDDPAGIDEADWPSPDDGPDALAAQRGLADALEAALAELPPAQRDVFVGHELDGRSFREMAAETGVGVSTLLARKRYAVRRLRRRLGARFGPGQELI